MASDHFDGKVRGRIDLQADLLLAANSIKVGEIIGLVPLDATSFGPAPKGGRTRHHARDFKFPDQSHDQTPQELLQTLVEEGRRQEKQAPIKIDHSRDRTFASNSQERGIPLPADIPEHDALVAVYLNGRIWCGRIVDPFGTGRDLNFGDHLRKASGQIVCRVGQHPAWLTRGFVFRLSLGQLQFLLVQRSDLLEKIGLPALRFGSSGLEPRLILHLGHAIQGLLAFVAPLEDLDHELCLLFLSLDSLLLSVTFRLLEDIVRVDEGQHLPRHLDLPDLVLDLGESHLAVAKFQVSALLEGFQQAVPGGGALHLQEFDVGVQVGDPSAEPGLRRIRGVSGRARPRAGHDEKGGQQSRRDGASAQSRHRCDSSSTGSASPSQKLLDRIVDSFLVTDLGEGEIRDFVEGFLELAVELARAVRALDLPVAEEVALGQELVAQEADAVAVILSPVVAVGEVEHVDVPVDGGMELVDDLVRQRVGRADPRSAAFPGVVEGVLVDLAGDRVVDDVASGHAVVLAFQPGVDPEGLGPDDLFLVVGHRARHVHQVEHHRVELRHGDRVPGTVELIFADRDDQGIARVVLARGDLALECLLVGALEVTQAFRAGLADAGVLVLLFNDVGAALGRDPGQCKLFTQDLGKVIHGELDLKDMMARCLGGPLARLAVAGSPDRGPHVAGPLPYSATVLGPVAELGDLDLRQWDRHELAARLADQLAVGDVLAQVRLDLPADDLLEPIGISIDFSDHGSPAPAVACIGSTISAQPQGLERSADVAFLVTGPTRCSLAVGLLDPPSRRVKITSGWRSTAQAASSAARKG